jgi:hypothetical protein
MRPVECPDRRGAGRGRHDGARHDENGQLPAAAALTAGPDGGGGQDLKIPYVGLEFPQPFMHRT